VFFRLSGAGERSGIKQG